jgi:hypothetical protein
MCGVREMRRARLLRSKRAVRRVGLAALAVSLLTLVLAETRAQPALDDAASVLTYDRLLADSMRGGDKSAARRLLSLQFTYTDESGRAYSRREFLGELKNIASATADDPKVTMYGLLALVTGDRKSAAGNTAFFLDIWVRQKRAWRALAMQNVLLGESTPAAAPSSPGDDSRANECRNPCQIMPYRVRSPAEQEVLNTFLAIEKASMAHDAQEWSKHVADEFVLYRSGYPPINKAERIALIERLKEAGRPTMVGELQAVHLSVYGDAAAMIASETVPDNSRPPYHAARVWVRRNGQWLLAISVQTDIQTP